MTDMCYWEEQHWIRTKSIHSAEFFHGTLEIIDRDTQDPEEQKEIDEQSRQLGCQIANAQMFQIY